MKERTVNGCVVVALICATNTMNANGTAGIKTLRRDHSVHGRSKSRRLFKNQTSLQFSSYFPFIFLFLLKIVLGSEIM